MTSKIRPFFLFLVIGHVTYFLACQGESETKKDPKPIEYSYKGREVSELAFLMRKMHDTLEILKPGLDTLGRTELYNLFESIDAASPTSPRDTSGNYDMMALSYLNLLENFDRADTNKRVAYTRLISGCESCHMQSCPGPLSLIDKLKL
jgi:hypothetical protein